MMDLAGLKEQAKAVSSRPSALPCRRASRRCGDSVCSWHALSASAPHTSWIAGPPRFLCSCAPQLNPVVGYWDPLNLAEGEFWGDSTEATIGFLREVRCRPRNLPERGCTALWTLRRQQQCPS